MGTFEKTHQMFGSFVCVIRLARLVSQLSSNVNMVHGHVNADRKTKDRPRTRHPQTCKVRHPQQQASGSLELAHTTAGSRPRIDIVQKDKRVLIQARAPNLRRENRY